MSQAPSFTALSEAAESLLGRLADEVQLARERGEAVDLQTLACQYPELADVIGRVFPALGLLGAAPRTDSLEAAECLGDFRLLRELGRGGMGVVYEAEQRSLGRRVALKVLPFAAMLDDRQLRRFRNEAHAAAVLKHPHIVSVFAVGCERGVHFYAMELVDGCSLADLLRPARVGSAVRTTSSDFDSNSPATDESNAGGNSAPGDRSARRALPDGAADWASTVRLAVGATLLSGDGRSRARAVAQLGATAAEALAFAHREGVIHRDIKPANLLVDSHGKLWITDFGLARVGASGDLTMTGDVLGTLRYMSPEQLRGDAVVDERTDVYSLGLTLYEALVGRPAFDAESREALVRQVLERDPPRPRQRAPQVPADLETIVLRATDKERDRRYANAAELADDLRRFLEHRPIRARQPSLVGGLRKQARRRPLVASLLATTAVLIVVMLIGASWLSARSLRFARLATAEAENARALQYASDLQVAYAVFDAGDGRHARGLLERHRPRRGERDLRGFEWRLLDALCRGVETLPQVHTGALVSACPYSPDGRRLATPGPDGKVVIRGAETLTALAELTGHDEDAWGLAWSADGQWIAAGAADGAICLWSASDGRLVRRWSGHQRSVLSLDFSPDGRFLASGSADGRLAVWSVPEGEPRGEHREHQLSVNGCCFSPDGRQVASVGWDDRAVVAEAPDCRVVGRYELGGNGVSAAFVRGGQALAVGGGFGVGLIDLELGKLAISKAGHAHSIHGLCASPDGEQFATAGLDNRICIWSSHAIEGQPRVIRFFGKGLASLAWSPRGDSLAVGGHDRTLRTCPVGIAGWAPEALHTDLVLLAAAWSADGRRLAAAGRGPSVWLCDGASLNRVGEPLPHGGGQIFDLAFSPDSRWLATAGDDGSAKIWSAQDGRLARSLGPHPGAARSVAFASGRQTHRLLVGDQVGNVTAWDAETGVQAFRRPLHRREILTLAAGHDGEVFFSGDAVGDVGCWDAQANPRWRRTLRGAGAVRRLCLSPQGDALALATDDGEIRLLDPDSGEVIGQLSGHLGRVSSLAFLDDSRLASGSFVKTVRFWDWRGGRLVGCVSRHNGAVMGVAAAPRGDALISASTDRRLRLWTAASD